MDSIKKHSQGLNISLYVAALALFVAVLSALFFYREFGKLRETSKNLQLREQVIGLGKRIDSINISFKAFEQHVRKQFSAIHQSMNPPQVSTPFFEPIPQQQEQEESAPALPSKFVPRTMTNNVQVPLVEHVPEGEEEGVEEEEVELKAVKKSPKKKARKSKSKKFVVEDEEDESSDDGEKSSVISS